MKLKKKIPLIDQHDKYGFYGGKFGGNYVAETAIQPIKDLSNLFEKLRRDKKFLKLKQNDVKENLFLQLGTTILTSQKIIEYFFKFHHHY